MPAKDTIKILQDFIKLVAKQMDNVTEKFRSRAAPSKPLVELLNGLSKSTQALSAEVARTFGALRSKQRGELLSTLERSGIISTVSLLTPVLKAEGVIFDSCLALHEASKTFYALSTDLAGLAGVLDPDHLGFPLTMASILFEQLGLQSDIAAQVCDDNDAAQAQAEMDEIDAIVKRLEQKIDYIMDLPDGVDVPPVPPNETPTSLTALRKMLEVAKKFYKFEGSFKPTFRKDKQLIRIGPLATSTLPSPPVPILVTGLIDLGGMQNHDVVTITTKVLEPKPSPQYVIWRVKTFTGPQSSGIKHFQDFADLLEVPGDGVEILIAQSASSHNFDPAFLLTIPYQFLVETTVLPDFNVS